MRIGGKEIPCGCDARREIMFETGGFGATEGVILASAVLILFISWRVFR